MLLGQNTEYSSFSMPVHLETARGYEASKTASPSPVRKGAVAEVLLGMEAV